MRFLSLAAMAPLTLAALAVLVLARPTPALAQDAAPSDPQAADQQPPAANAQDFPDVPDGALYTIYCLTISTPTHVPDAIRLKDQLINKTGSHDWYVIHSETNSMLYYGFYKTFDDDSQPAEKARAQHDLHWVATLKDTDGDFPFAQCIFQPINAPDPPAPPEWNLKNANGYWSVQIAAYLGSPLRKQYAVDAVRKARAMGIEAYYYHGRSISSVCIGAWPREAVKEQDSADARSDEAGRHLLVLPEPLPKGTRTDNVYDSDGNKVKVMAPKVEIQDPSLLAVFRQYPQDAINGEIHFYMGQGPNGPVKVPDPSFLVVIPHSGDQDDINGGAPTIPGAAAPGDAGGGGNGAAASDQPNPLEN